MFSFQCLTMTRKRQECAGKQFQSHLRGFLPQARQDLARNQVHISATYACLFNAINGHFRVIICHFRIIFSVIFIKCNFSLDNDIARLFKKTSYLYKHSFCINARFYTCTNKHSFQTRLPFLTFITLSEL